MSWRPSSTHLLTNGSSIFDMKNRQQPLSNLSRLCAQIRQTFSPLVNKPGIYSSICLKAAGFRYTGNGNTARCEECGLEISHWTLDMKPWAVHSTRMPHCPFVRRLRADAFSNVFSSLSRPRTVERNTAEQENPPKRRKTETIDLESPSNTSVEADLFQQARKHTFFDWPHRSTPLIEHMTKAGFFACNVGDRVMCIHCNIVCHQWTPHVDEPCEIHKILSPHCPYVKEKLSSGELPRIVNDNQNSTSALASNHLSTRNSTHSFQFSNLLRPPEQHGRNSCASRPSTVSPTMSIAEQIRQDSFYPRIKHDEACADCKKSLQNMGPCDSEMADCARWFVHCVHTKQFSADQVYDQIQNSKQAQRRRAEGNAGSNGTLVAARLVLQIPQQLLDQNFSLSILQRIWENEIQLKPDDSMSDVDLLMACILFQKQIDCIDGKAEKIVKPSTGVLEIRKPAEYFAQRQAATTINVGMAQANNSMPSNPCVLCVIEEKRLACMPCGHLATCVPCGQSLRSCPICQREITAFVRIFS